MNPPSALVRLHQAATRSRTLRYQQRRTRLEAERARRDDVAYGDLLATARAVSRGDELAGLLGMPVRINPDVPPGYVFLMQPAAAD